MAPCRWLTFPGMEYLDSSFSNAFAMRCWESAACSAAEVARSAELLDCCSDSLAWCAFHSDKRNEANAIAADTAAIQFSMFIKRMLARMVTTRFDSVSGHKASRPVLFD